MNEIEIVTVEIGHPRYEELIGALRTDAVLLRRMWLDAESNLDERPGKRWVVAVVDGVAAAWAAAYVEAGVLHCCNSYERPGFRDRGLYAAVYRHRHDTIVAPWAGPALTFVYDQPLCRHLADGWDRLTTGFSVVDEPDGDGETIHRWHELRRGPIDERN